MNFLAQPNPLDDPNGLETDIEGLRTQRQILASTIHAHLQTNFGDEPFQLKEYFHHVVGNSVPDWANSFDVKLRERVATVTISTNEDVELLELQGLREIIESQMLGYAEVKLVVTVKNGGARKILFVEDQFYETKVFVPNTSTFEEAERLPTRRALEIPELRADIASTKPDIFGAWDLEFVLIPFPDSELRFAMVQMDISSDNEWGVARAWLDVLEEIHGITIILDDVPVSSALDKKLSAISNGSDLLTSSSLVWSKAFKLHGIYLDEDAICLDHFGQQTGLVDLRDLELIAIDGEETLDREDAIGGRILPNGEVELNIAIVDTSWLFEDGRNQDLLEYAKRGCFTYYAPHQNLYLLGQEVMHGLGSLNADEDRIAWVLSLRIDREGGIVIDSVRRSWVNTNANLAYDNLTLDPASAGEYSESYAAIVEAAMRLRYKSIGSHHAWGISNENISRIAVAETMVAAYSAFAEHLEESGRPFIRRVHKYPTPEERERLIGMIRAEGINIEDEDLTDSARFKNLLETLRTESKGTYRVVLMTFYGRAHYQPFDGEHVGLGLERYARPKSQDWAGLFNTIQATENRFSQGDAERACWRLNRKQLLHSKIHFLYLRLTAIAKALERVGEVFTAQVRSIRGEDVSLHIPDIPLHAVLNPRSGRQLAGPLDTLRVRLEGYSNKRKAIEFALVN